MMKIDRIQRETRYFVQLQLCSRYLLSLKYGGLAGKVYERRLVMVQVKLAGIQINDFVNEFA